MTEGASRLLVLMRRSSAHVVVFWYELDTKTQFDERKKNQKTIVEFLLTFYSILKKKKKLTVSFSNESKS